MTLPVEQQFDAVMHQTFALQTFAEPGFIERIDGALFQHARTDAVFAVVACPRFDDDRIDALQPQQMSE